MSGPPGASRIHSGVNSASSPTLDSSPDVSDSGPLPPLVPVDPVRLRSSGPLLSSGSSSPANSVGGQLGEIVSKFTDARFQAKTVPIAGLFRALVEGMDGADPDKGLPITLTYHFANKRSVEVSLTLQWNTSNTPPWIAVAEPAWVPIPLEAEPVNQLKWGIKLPRYYSTRDGGQASARPGSRVSQSPHSVTVTRQFHSAPGLPAESPRYQPRRADAPHAQPRRRRSSEEEFDGRSSHVGPASSRVRYGIRDPNSHSHSYLTMFPEDIGSGDFDRSSLMANGRDLSQSVHSLSSNANAGGGSSSSSSSSPMFSMYNVSNQTGGLDEISQTGSGDRFETATSDHKGQHTDKALEPSAFSRKSKVLTPDRPPRKSAPSKYVPVNSVARARTSPALVKPKVVTTRPLNGPGEFSSSSSTSTLSRAVIRLVPVKPRGRPELAAKVRADTIRNENKQTGDQVRKQKQDLARQRATTLDGAKKAQFDASINSPKTERQRVEERNKAAASEVQAQSKKLRSLRAQSREEELARKREFVAAQRASRAKSTATRSNPKANKD